MLNRKGIFFCLIGPAGSGKSTLSKMLLTKDTTLSPSVSLTSRSPRIGEIEGKDYFFVSKDQFKSKIANNEVFEWEETHGNLYGTLSATLEAGIKNGTDLLFDIDIRGALRFKKSYPLNAVIVFIAPPSPNILRERLVKRGTNDSEMEVRLSTAKTEYASFLANKKNIDYFIVNDILSDTYNKIENIIDSERSKIVRLNDNDLDSICVI